MSRRPLTLNQIRDVQPRGGPHVARLEVLQFVHIVRAVEAAHGITNEAADKAEASAKLAMRAADLTAEQVVEKVRGANTRVVEITVKVGIDQARAAITQAMKESREALGAVGLGLVLAAAYAARAGDDSGGERVRAVRNATGALLKQLEAAGLSDPGEGRVGDTITKACNALGALLEATK